MAGGVEGGASPPIVPKISGTYTISQKITDRENYKN
jgi:hypothetical protein